MNWRLVLAIGITFGLLMALDVLLGWPARLDNPASVAVVVISAVILARAGGKVFTNGFFTGLLIGLLQLGLALVQWDRFTTNHPELVNVFALPGTKVGMKTAMLIFMAPISLAWGLAIGLLAWLLYRLLGLARNARAAGSRSE